MDDIVTLREKIDKVDDQILGHISQRVKICQAIGELKKQQRKPVQDIDREKQVYQRIRDHAESLMLDPIMVERIYREIVNMCSTVQE
ncbi:MAG: chorismate mutase [Candidatus Bathyarchaeia archaeon]